MTAMAIVRRLAWDGYRLLLTPQDDGAILVERVVIHGTLWADEIHESEQLFIIPARKE